MGLVSSRREVAIEVARKKIRICIGRGAELLDEIRPGWADSLDPTALDMESCSYCILGHLFGHYSVGREEALRARPGLTTFDGDVFGFDLDLSEERELAAHGAGLSYFDLLAEEWTSYIRQRQSS